MSSERLIDDIKSRIDIVDLIEEYVTLKKSGQNHKGLCPFHSEKTPSFTVNPAKQIFHCFGCNKGGDIFTFLMTYENITFQEALQSLAKKAGIDIDQLSGRPFAGESRKEPLYAIYKEAMSLYCKNLERSRHAMTYLRERGITEESIRGFSLGYSKNEREGLFNHLKGAGFSIDLIKTSGLVHFGEKGNYDFFRDRIMFPRHDLQGRVIAFGGRLLQPSPNAPKYINSSDSAIFKKGETLYALYHAKNEIVKKGYAVVVEGYLDALMCHQHGVMNTVAPLGTAMTEGHLKKMKRFAGKVVLIFDGDAAGISATKRALGLVFSEGMTAKVLLMPEGEDPDTFLRKYGNERFRRSLGAAISPIQFIMKSFGKNKLDGVRYALMLLAPCPDALLREDVLRELSERSNISEMVLHEELGTLGKRYSRTDMRQSAVKKNDQQEALINQEELILLNITLSMPEKAYAIINLIGHDGIETPILKRIFQKIMQVSDEGIDRVHFVKELLQRCEEDETSLITRLLLRPEIDLSSAEDNIAGCLRKIFLRRIDGEIRSAEQQGEVQRLQALLKEKASLLIQPTTRKLNT